MKPLLPLIALAAASAAAAPAAADPLREFCPDRPGLGTPPCTIDRGHGDVEIGLADWSLDKEKGTRSDIFTFGDMLVRYGVSDSLEVQIGWTAFAYDRERDAAGARHGTTGTGDVRIALRRNIRHPDGSGLSVAIMPVLSLPTGGATAGAGDWGAALLVPLSYQLPRGLQLDLTGEVDAAPDADRSGRHLAFGGVAGLDVPLGKSVTATFELAAQRDEDPSGARNQVQSGLSLAWMAGRSLQLDAGANKGIAGGASDLELYFGVARRF